MSLDKQIETYKPTFWDGMKLGIGYFVDPLGRIMENWENVAVNGLPLRDNYSQTLFERLSEDAHKGNSFAKYAGAGIGIVSGITTLAIATVPYGSMAVGTFVYDGIKTFGKGEKKIAEPDYSPTFWEGLKGGFGIGVDPAGFFLENIERNLVNGKGIDENRIRSVTESLTRDARKGNSWKKYIGGVIGLGSGTLVSYLTLGLVPLGTGIYDVIASVRNKPKKSP